MDNNKKGREYLRGRFVKNAIPKQQDFADVIDAALNQKDDGIAKPAGEPLSIEAAADGNKTALRIYEAFTDEKPAWELSLRDSGKKSFALSDGDGNRKLVIDRETGALTATGAIQANGGLTTTGAIRTGTLTATGAIQANGGLTIPTGQTLSVNGDSQFTGSISAKRYASEDVPLSDYAAPPANVFLYSPAWAPPNDHDAWIYLDSGSGPGHNWGIYHRQIDGELRGLPANSIGFIGANTLKAYISLQDGTGHFSALTIGTTDPGGNKLRVAGNVLIDGTLTVKQEDWKSPTLLGLWRVGGPAQTEPGFFKDSCGIVHLRGCVTINYDGGGGGVASLTSPWDIDPNLTRCLLLARARVLLALSGSRFRTEETS